MSYRQLAGLYCFFVSSALLGSSLAAQETDPLQQAEQPLPGAEDRAAIEKGIQAYVEAFNNKDIDGVVNRWSPEGVYIDQSTGQQMSGREEIKESLQAVFASASKGRLTVEVESIDFVSPNVALEKGASTITRDDGNPSVTRYNAVHIKRDGSWLIDRLTETEVITPPSRYEQLKDLEWMVGRWRDQDDQGVVASECHWARNKNFLVRSFNVSMAGVPDMAGMQLIGWDPANHQIRSWTFDSDGGFNHAIWKKSGSAWSIQQTATLPDGRLASATTIMAPLNPNSFTWEQVHRVVDGELLPNLPKITIDRAEED
jgi:uncharacterized protein (TIGR02246 family)